jgi:hypothetical protein
MLLRMEKLCRRQVSARYWLRESKAKVGSCKVVERCKKLTAVSHSKMPVRLLSAR